MEAMEKDIVEPPLHNTGKKADVICYDLDGTVADDYHRLHYALDGNWDEYFSETRHQEDKVFPGAKAHMRDLRRNSNSYGVYLTARWEMLRECTLEWLVSNKLPGFPLYMKQNGRNGEAAKFKFEVMKELVDSGHSSAMLFDDKQEIVDYINAQGDPRITARKPHWETYPKGARVW